MKAVYNLVQRHSSATRGDRNRAQQMLQLAVEKNYIFFTKEEGSEHRLNWFFMCHPEAAKMYRAYPYVVLIDSTYKTNQYKRAVVEMVGVTPVGKNFLIAWALVKDETEASYTWVLDCLKKLLPRGIHPTTLVTDRELGLGAAIRVVFPDVNHVLCIWHIYKNVETRALELMRHEGLAKHCAFGMFGKIVNARTLDEFLQAWDEFKIHYHNRPFIVEYVDQTWMELKVKWARCFVDHMLHLGNRATSRVEAQHASLKLYIHSSMTACDSMWMRAHQMWEAQLSEVRKQLSDSKGKKLVTLAGPFARLFSHLGCVVSHKAIKLMRDEYKRGRSLGVGLQEHCGCSLPRTHGLPCACELHDLSARERRVDMRSLHVFWRTLVYGDHPVAPDDTNVDREVLIERIRNMDPSMFPGLEEVVDRYFQPQHEDVEEPTVADRPRGRPRKNSTTRDPSRHEHVSRSIPSTQSQTPPTAASWPNAPNTPYESGYLRTRTVRQFPFRDMLPNWFRSYYEAYFDPAGDGHCGFRCLSHASIGSDTNWMAIRRSIGREVLRNNEGYYEVIYSGHVRDALIRIVWTGEDIPCGPRYWMEELDLFAFATLHSWTICVISCIPLHPPEQGVTRWGCATFLPLTAQADVEVPLGEVWLLHDGSHWRRIRVSAGAPMPPIHPTWYMEGARDPETDRFIIHYADRLETWVVANEPTTSTF